MTTNGKKGIEKLDPSKIQESISQQHLRGEELHGITKADGFAFMENMDSSQLDELTSQYFNFEEKGKYFFLFTGMSEFEREGKKIPVVLLEDKDGNTLINGNTVLVNSLKKITDLPTYVRVDYVSDERSASGTYKNLKVFVLPKTGKPNQGADVERKPFE